MSDGSLTLAMTESVWSQLTHALESEVETAWVLTARLVNSGHPETTKTLLIRTCEAVPETAYARRKPDGLSIGTAGWLPAFQRADEDGSVPIFVHTHPGGNPSHSRYDDAVDAELSRVAANRNELGAYASLVVGGVAESPTFAGRLLADSGGKWQAIDRLRIVGPQLRILTSSSAGDSGYDPEVFNRQILAFGEAGQALLKQLRVGVVGAGGTGSSVIEQLVRLGVGHLVVIDKQALEGSNVTRVYGSTIDDQSVPKVEIAAAQSKRIGLGTILEPLQGSVSDPAVTMALAQCDVIFGCTDDALGRAILTRLPTYLLQQLVDCGVVLDSRGGRLHGIYGRVTCVTPLSPCLVCTGDVDPTQLRNEQLPPDELAALQREGYAPELDHSDPAVVAYTTLTAAQAVNEMLGRLFGYLETDANRRTLLIHDFAISNTHRPRIGKHMCGDIARLARGVEPPFLGWPWPPEAGHA